MNNEKILFIDTHNQKEFGIGVLENNQYIWTTGQDACANLLNKLLQTTNAINFDEIIIVKGPGSLTSLRIGSSTALGLALGCEKKYNKKVKIQAITIWEILTNHFKKLFENFQILFYTGTKKWILQSENEQKIVEIEDIKKLVNKNINFISNNPEKLNGIVNFNIEYPRIIELLPEYKKFASYDLDLIYPITNF